MAYNKELVVEAWKEAVSTGKINRAKLRPAVADAWERCIQSGLDPWSNRTTQPDTAKLAHFRQKYSSLLENAHPVLRYIVTVFNCNCSIADKDAFVFELLSPLSSYPRTFGTHVLESVTGNGNITMCLHDGKPSRCDGYEHFRVVSQNYSGVASMFTVDGESFVLCMNDPFSPLPENALNTCVSACRMIEKLCSSRREAFTHLSSASFFTPLLENELVSAIVTDLDGMLLAANSEGKELVPSFDKYPYASRSLGAYLKTKNQLAVLLNEKSMNPEETAEEYVFNIKGKGAKALKLLRSSQITLLNSHKHHIFVFETPIDVVAAVEESATPARTNDFENIGESVQWQQVNNIVNSVVQYRSNVMITGETGTGKEIIARTLHRKSGRKGEFVAINCGALPKELLASELFGYEGGAFTGARASGAKGKFEYADGGTLFLDEVGELPLEMQSTLLRVLQDRTVMRIGANKPIPIDVRVIAATNRDVRQLIKDGKFRTDLWYRLSIIEIQLPPLRERSGDITLLAKHFNETLSESLSIPSTPLPEDVLNLLESYQWPGNVRELRNAIERALIISNGSGLTPESFPDQLYRSNTIPTAPIEFFNIDMDSSEEVAKPAAKQTKKTAPQEKKPSVPSAALSPKEIRRRIEREKIIAVLEDERGNISRSAAKLKMSRSTLYRKIEQLDINIFVTASLNKDE